MLFNLPVFHDFKKLTPKGLSIDIFGSLIGGGGAARDSSFDNGPPEHVQ